MRPALLALKRALVDLLTPRMLWMSLWPYPVALLLWGLLGWLFGPQAWSGLQEWLAASPLPSWLDPWEAALGGAGLFLGMLLAWPLLFLTAQVVVALAQMPLMARFVERHYPGLERRDGGSTAGSFRVALASTLGFAGLWLLFLPLWLLGLPGFLASVLLGGWFNARLYPYDALSLHADAKELRHILRTQGKGHLWLGLGLSLLQHVPLLGLLLPVYTGLAYLHYDLDCLRAQRQALPDSETAA